MSKENVWLEIKVDDYGNVDVKDMSQPNQFLNTALQYGEFYKICLEFKSKLQELKNRNNTVLDLEVNTRFYVINGCWYGRVVQVDGEKHILVESTGDVFKPSKERASDMEFRIVSNDPLNAEVW